MEIIQIIHNIFLQFQQPIQSKADDSLVTYSVHKTSEIQKMPANHTTPMGKLLHSSLGGFPQILIAIVITAQQEVRRKASRAKEDN